MLGWYCNFQSCIFHPCIFGGPAFPIPTFSVVLESHSYRWIKRLSSATVCCRDGFPILPSQTGFCKVYYLTPLLSNNRDKRGLALDGKLKHEDTNLASSAMSVY